MRQFTVVIPTRNEMSTGVIKKSLPLLASQAHLEIIIVDNNSMDGSLDFYKKFDVLDHCLFFNKNLLSAEDKTPVPEVSIFEDTEFCLKLLRSAKPRRLKFVSTTSNVRFEKNGLVYPSLLNQIMKVGYHLKCSDEFMNRIYEKGLSLNSKY